MMKLQRRCAYLACLLLLLPAVSESQRPAAAVRQEQEQAAREVPQLAELLALKPGMTVADVGAGGGAMSVVMARWLGPGGRVSSYSVATRMKEIALRMALGAMPSGVLRLLFGRVVAQVMLGLALGVLGAYALGHVLQGMLVQTSPTDRQVLAAAGVVLLVVASVTCLVPARRATRIDPLEVLRSH
jgi:peptidoglycan/LPS O-acetylase OafA/YrhL